MANEKVEFDIVVNGKPAKLSIEGVEKAQKELDNTVGKTSKNIKTNWVAIGVAAGAVATAFASMMKQTMSLERVMFGLNDETKKWIRNASEQYGMAQDVIAGFVQTGKAAGMAGDDIQTMIDQAIALGRAYPHESTESFIDNLTMLNRTGEAQGYIVDILEQKYGQIDLKTLSLEQKQRALMEATQGVNEEFNKTTASAFDRVMQSLSNTVTDLGDSFAGLIEESGILTGVNKIMEAGALASTGYAMALNRAYAVIQDIAGYDTSDLDAKYQELVKLSDLQFNKLFGVGDDTITLPGIDVGGGRPKPPPLVDEAELKKALDTQNQFWDDYNKSIMTAYEYELNILSQRYAEYNKYVKDKAALDEWYASEQKKLFEEFDLQMQAYKEMGDAVTDGLTRGILRFTETGKANFKEMANSIIQDMLKIQIQSSMMSLFGGFGSGGGGLLGGAFDLLFNAKGNAFTNGNVQAFANGGVVSSPTMFPMANGAGIMGEAGSEVIAPLKRDSKGNMGVGAVPPVVNVNVQNYGNDNVQVQQNGNDIQVIISQITAQIERGTGTIGKAIEGRYGLRKQ